MFLWLVLLFPIFCFILICFALFLFILFCSYLFCVFLICFAFSYFLFYSHLFCFILGYFVLCFSNLFCFFLFSILFLFVLFLFYFLYSYSFPFIPICLIYPYLFSTILIISLCTSVSTIVTRRKCQLQQIIIIWLVQVKLSSSKAFNPKQCCTSQQKRHIDTRPNIHVANSSLWVNYGTIARAPCCLPYITPKIQATKHRRYWFNNILRNCLRLLIYYPTAPIRPKIKFVR